MDVDPRLQLSDLTDYQYQSSLAQQYNNNSSSNSSNNNNNNNYTSSRSEPRPSNSDTTQNEGYFQSVPPDEARQGLNSPRQLPSRPPSHNLQNQSPHRFGIASLYEPTSIPHAAQGFNPGKPSSVSGGAQSSNASRGVRGNHDGSAMNASTPQSQRSAPSENRDPTTFVPPHLLAPMKPNPPNLKEWRERFFNIEEPLLLTEEQYLTYFPHIDNVYSHRSTQKYKRKPFVSHYWDCRLKGRPTGTPINKKKGENGEEPEKKKRKRKIRERDLCDVKIKVTEFFGTDDLEALRKLGLGPDTSANTNQDHETGEVSFLFNKQQNGPSDSAFGILEPAHNYPEGHPGAGGKKWYMVQRVSGNDRDGDDGNGPDLDHKHTLEESDRIKKNSVQRWLLEREKAKKKAAKGDPGAAVSVNSEDNDISTETSTPPARYHASGFALQTLYSHTEPTSNNLTFYGCSYCPFAQRVWIALELIGIPYRYVEVTERDWYKPPNAPPGTPLKLAIPELADCNPEGKIPCIKHNNFAVWESLVMLEYLEDLAMGQSLFQPAVGNAQLKAHSRLWVDFINRRILPVFYALLLLPDSTARDVSGTEYEHPASIRAGERNAHANANPERYNDERYGMPSNSGPSLFPEKSQYDISTLSSGAANAASAVIPSGAYSLRVRTLISSLHSIITTLVNASHRTGPFFLGPTLSYVDIAFAPWIIRLSRVLSYYRGFPHPEVGTRWQAWCDAIENNEVVRRTVSEEKNYREVYSGAAYHTVSGGRMTTGWEYDEYGRVRFDVARERNNAFPEMSYARRIVETEGFGLGGDVWGHIAGQTSVPVDA